MSSAFHALTLGSSTRRKAPAAPASAQAQRSAKRQRHSSGATRDAHVHAAAEERALPADLDFFGTGTGMASSSKVTAGNVQQAAQGSGNDESDPADSDSDSEEDEDDEDDEEEDAPAPPAQKITISSTSPRSLPSSFHSFLELLSHPLPRRPIGEATRRTLARNLRRHGMRTMWGVQGAASGALLGLGLEEKAASVDVVCVAPTGSGKTLAYLLPLIMQLGRPARSLLAAAEGSEEGGGIRAIVVLPTHELASQIYQEAVRLTMPPSGSKGKGKEEQWRIIMLEKSTEAAVIASAPTAEDGESVLGIDILVSTPERLHALVEGEKIRLERTRFLVLDEADRLLSHEFKDQTNPILAAMTHPHLQKAFLSATMEAGPEALARTHLRDGGVRVVVGTKDAASRTVSQKLVFCGSEQGKLLALRQLVAEGELPPPTLLFVQSIERANQLYRQLLMEGNLEVGVVHSSLSKKAREDAVRDFKSGKTWVLVVTELMARGLDFKGVEVVVNYDFPQTVQSYVHRIGRTGRGGRTGKAITFFTLEDGPYLRTIANVMRASGCVVEPWMLELPKPSKNLKKDRRKAPLKRKDVGGGDAERLGKRQASKKRDIVQASKKKQLRDGQTQAASKAGRPSAMEVDLSE